MFYITLLFWSIFNIFVRTYYYMNKQGQVIKNPILELQFNYITNSTQKSLNSKIFQYQQFGTQICYLQIAPFYKQQSIDKFQYCSMRSRGRKQANHRKQSQQSQQQRKQLHVSQFRDYISMKANNNSTRNNINKSKRGKSKNQTKDMIVHQHLKHQQPSPVQQSEQQENHTDPISLLSNFNNENYKYWLNIMKERVATQKPFTQQPQQLLDCLACASSNVCIYGFGSKIQYIKHLLNTYLSDHYIWQVNGYKVSINDKKVYNNFGKFLIQIGLAKKIQSITRNDQFQEFKMILQQYQAFHCIDGMNFLDSDSQYNLSRLFSLPKIRLIATIDNIKIATIWHPEVKTRYNFRFFQINTKVPNLEEQISRPNTNDIRQKQDQAIMNIYQSLNNNQKRILKLFAKKQLDNYNRQQPQYYTMETLLEQCIDNVILSSDNQLRQNMLELVDHKVIVQQERIDNDRMKRFYTIKCNKAMLDRIYKQKLED